MRFPSLLFVLALGAQLAAPALADPPAVGRSPAVHPARHVPAGAAATAAPAVPRTPARRAGRVARRDGGTIAHITVGCASNPRRAPRPVVVIIPTIAVVVISVCITPQDVFRLRRG